jgi:ubiquinone/menaquinone biosynthesis C-methylase UbiE
MDEIVFPAPDKNGIINLLSSDLSEENRQRVKKFGAFVVIYDFTQKHFVRPRIHKADPLRHREILATLILPVKNAHVLDIACGTGGAIAHFHGSNDYTGLDLSYAMLKRAVKKAEKQSFNTCRFIQGNAEELLFEDESFDFVLMDTALHMIPQYRSAIAEIARVLNKDGLFVCSTPAVGISREFDKTWKKISATRSLHSLCVNDIKSVCALNGLHFNQYDTNGGLLYFKAHKI